MQRREQYLQFVFRALLFSMLVLRTRRPERAEPNIRVETGVRVCRDFLSHFLCFHTRALRAARTLLGVTLN